MKKPETPPIINPNHTYKQIMDELIKINKFNKFFEIEDTEYPYWEEWKYKSKEWEIASEKIWSCAKSSRFKKSFINFSTVSGFTFHKV